MIPIKTLFCTPNYTLLEMQVMMVFKHSPSDIQLKFPVSFIIFQCFRSIDSLKNNSLPLCQHALHIKLLQFLLNNCILPRFIPAPSYRHVSSYRLQFNSFLHETGYSSQYYSYRHCFQLSEQWFKLLPALGSLFGMSNRRRSIPYLLPKYQIAQW